MLLPPEVLVNVVQQIEAPVDRWQTAASLAMAGAFGREWKEYLRPVWAAEAEALGKSAEAGPYTTVDDLKHAAFMAGLPTRGLKKAGLLALVPQIVPPCVVDAAREALRERRIDRDVEEYLDSDADHGRRITATEAKATYCLREEDVDALVYEERRNPHYRSGPPMRLFSVRDVVVAAYERHGGKAALAAAQAASRTRKAARQTKREAEQRARHEALAAALDQAGVSSLQIDHPRAAAFVADGMGGYAEHVVACIARDVELRAALAERGLPFREDSRLCESYIRHGERSVAEIVDIMDEMRFYHEHTDYAIERRDLYRRHGDYRSATEISEMAKARVWTQLAKQLTAGPLNKTGQRLLARLPPSLRRRLEADTHV
jgi:XPA protein C-terminus